MNVHDPRVTEKFKAKVGPKLLDPEYDSYGEALQAGLDHAVEWFAGGIGSLANRTTVSVEKFYVVEAKS